MSICISYYTKLKSFGGDCTNKNGMILKLGVLLYYVINGDLHHTVFAGFRYLNVYIKVLYTYIGPKI